ncbi:ATP-grasp domain-containing protein [Maribacter dokdonensis]|uniref:ATP-grasp domain-containing protein n=1 Tax=Maribacter dokdonensis TaxID=320912 RepID=UPI001C09954E|nr:ATP-grasp domain-containing protein [Maribacter dokdonensis]MBU2901656.1 ATP-grasp domain-containing protein [Maribacter dokdonensis]
MDKIAILYQAQLPPIKEGIQKPMKPGGYADSGADIAFALLKNQYHVITPVEHPNENIDKDWVFPDTEDGIKNALNKGAKIFWLNTVLYNHHNIEKFYNEDLYIVGQTPSLVDTFDDKMYTNYILATNNIPIPKNQLITNEDYNNLSLDLKFPLVLKPIRGRGSQGVTKINNQKNLLDRLHAMFSNITYGTAVYIEEFLIGKEITITVMPKGNYMVNGKELFYDRPWCLPAVERYNHDNGIAPYNGTVAVMENSKVLSDAELQSNEILEVYEHCVKSAEIIDIKAPIRIDCRSNSTGKYYLFDLNMKPNMTGPSRSHRNNQDSLSLLSARKIGWNYIDLLSNILNQKWNSVSIDK